MYSAVIAYEGVVAMTYVIAETCIGKMGGHASCYNANGDHSPCTPVCPVDCIYERDTQYYIEPSECIDCGACVPECPVEGAIIPPPEVAALEAEMAADDRRSMGLVDDVPRDEPEAENVASEDAQGG